MIREVAVAVLAALLLLSGCANTVVRLPAPASADAFSLNGRLSVTHGSQNLSGKIAWSHAPARDDISLASPLGNQIAQLERDASGVVLTDGARQQWRAADAESLTEKTLGWRLPLTGLVDWVRGRPATGASTSEQRDAQGRLLFLTQSGWRLEFAYPDSPDEPGRLPRRIFMRYLQSAEPLEIRLVIDEWSAS